MTTKSIIHVGTGMGRTQCNITSRNLSNNDVVLHPGEIHPAKRREDMPLWKAVQITYDMDEYVFCSDCFSSASECITEFDNE